MISYGGSALSPDPQGITEAYARGVRRLFIARLTVLLVIAPLLAVPSWNRFLGTQSPTAFFFYLCVLGYTAAAFRFGTHPRLGRKLTAVSLALDAIAVALLTVQSGALLSPLVAAAFMLPLMVRLIYREGPAPLLPLSLFVLLALFDMPGLPAGQRLFLVLWFIVLAGIVLYAAAAQPAPPDPTTAVREQKAHDLAIVTEERLRLAREIHDGLGGNLSSLIMQSEFLQRLNKDPELSEEITALKAEAEEAIEELRRSLTMMRRDFDLHKALEDYCLRFEERSEASCDFKVKGSPCRIPSEMQLAVFRVLQECLTNAQKHAQAKAVKVRLRYQGYDLVTLKVEDDGVGFDPKKAERPGHYGLTNLHERARKFRGRVELRSTPGEGATVEVSLAIPAEGSHVAFLPGH